MLALPVPPPVVSPPLDASPPALPAIVCDDPRPGRVGWRMFPPWLLSLVLHLNVMIALGLWQWRAEIGPSAGELEVTLAAADGAEPTALAATVPEFEAELVAAAPAEMTPLALATSENVAPQEVSLASFAVPTKSNQRAATKSGDAQKSAGRGDGHPDATRTGIFGLETTGRRFVYVFDRSASMNSTFQTTAEGQRPVSHMLLDGAKRELLASLDRLNPKQHFHIIFYNHETVLLGGARARRLRPATPRNKMQASAFVYQLYGQGETYHLPALEQALRLRPDVIFLLTDGEAKDDPTDADLKQLARLNTRGTVINVVQIVPEPRIDSTLIRLAEEHSGQHRFLTLRELHEAVWSKATAESSSPTLKAVY